MPYQKSTQEYRRDIFSLKAKLKQEQKYLEQLKQKHSDVDILGQEKSYSWNLKLKILQYNLAAIKQNMQKYRKDQAYDIYALNFATLALIKSSEIFMINRQMIFRAVDIKSLGKVSVFDFSLFLKQTLKLDDEFIKPITEVLTTVQNGTIARERYNKYLECFLVNSEQQNRQITSIDQACDNIARLLIMNQINPDQIWKSKEINIAIFVQGISRKLNKIIQTSKQVQSSKKIRSNEIHNKNRILDILDCIGLYCKLDPTKKGYIDTKDAILFLRNKMTSITNFNNIRLLK